ncbi:MAG: hypothetical protein ACI4D3_00350 [Lachnospiraceae bacterium]
MSVNGKTGAISDKFIHELLIAGRDEAIDNLVCDFQDKPFDSVGMDRNSIVQLICDIADNVLYRLLLLIQTWNKLKITLEGEVIELPDDLEEILFGENGYIQKYCKEEYICKTKQHFLIKDVSDFDYESFSDKLKFAYAQQGDYANKELLLFGYELIRFVRDEIIIYCDNNFDRNIDREYIPIMVDQTLGTLLLAIEQFDDQISIYVDGMDIMLISDGLCGELYTEFGWIALFSKERYYEIF